MCEIIVRNKLLFCNVNRHVIRHAQKIKAVNEQALNLPEVI